MLNYATAVLLILGALYAKLVDKPLWLCLLLLVMAALEIYLGMQKQKPKKPVELTDEQRQQILEMKKDGKEVAAIRQVRLWYRGTDLLTAKNVVDQVDDVTEQ